MLIDKKNCSISVTELLLALADLVQRLIGSGGRGRCHDRILKTMF